MIIKLLHPIVATERDLPAALVTLPAGATLEYETDTFTLHTTTHVAEARWAGKVYMANFQDLLNALSVEDAARCSCG